MNTEKNTSVGVVPVDVVKPNDKPRISIITVTYNSAAYLQDCIDSIKSQDYDNIEYIIIDGKSSDGTQAIIRKNDDVVDFYLSETDKGMYDAINKGISIATGEFVGLLNSDDILDNPKVISRVVKTFTEQKVDSVYGDIEYVDRFDVNRVMRIWKGKPFKRSRFAYGWMPAHPSFYIRRSLIEKHGAYETHFYSAADYEFMCRYLYKHKVTSAYIPSLMVRMRLGGQSNNTLKARFRANRRDYLAMKRNDIPMPFVTSILKPLIKVHQFMGRGGLMMMGWI
jgi:glycosyltransferase involved in cell wall biosynthesis